MTQTRDDNRAASRMLREALQNPDLVNESDALNAIGAGAYVETPILYPDQHDPASSTLTPLAAVCLIRETMTADRPARYHRARIMTALLDTGADPAQAATLLLCLARDAIDSGDLALSKRAMVGIHIIAIELATRLRNARAPEASPER